MAVRRRAAALARGVTDRQHSERSAFFIEVQGAGGELVVAKWLGVWPDTDFSLERRGHDLLTPSGKWRIDVKTTEHNGGRLIIPVSRKKRLCDIFVLVTGQMPRFRIVGGAWEYEVFATKPVMWNKRMVYLREQEQMGDPIKLKEM